VTVTAKIQISGNSTK